MKIVLLRHGRPIPPAFPWITAFELGRWIDAYNRTGIRESTPPRRALNAAGTCSVIITSDLARSIESGKALARGMPIMSDGLFREAGLPYGPFGSIKMPPMVWAAFFRLRWFFGYNANGESIHAFRERSRRAAGRLIVLAKEHGNVLFVGHGLINGHIARELLAAGWKGPVRPRYRHWACTEYTRGNSTD